MKIYNWRPFLDRWRADWAASGDGGGELGFPAADEARITALEERLGAQLPPSYRSFLSASDGWVPVGTAVKLMGTTDCVHWYEDTGLPEMYESALDEHSTEDEALRAGMWGRALQLAIDSDLTDVLLDPGDVNPDGEWAAYVHRARSGELPDRYESFLDLMQAMFQEFHSHFSAELGDAFSNETTRELDADVEAARLDILAGDDIEGPLEVLDDAWAHGRRRAGVLRAQVRALLGPRGSGGGAQGPAREQRYEAPGPFGEAVEAARALALAGDTDGAWRTLALAVPAWRSSGDDDLAPVGLLADPVLGPVITPERGVSILQTPRAGLGKPSPGGPSPEFERGE